MTSQYWDKKILKWEFLRYSMWSWPHPGSWSIRARYHRSLIFLKKLSLDKEAFTILDLGCGSALLLDGLKSIVTLNYWGFDISTKAIQKAQKKYPKLKDQLIVRDLEADFSYPKSDICVLLGVSDWIKTESLFRLLNELNADRVLISYTEKSKNLKTLVYGLYRRIYDGNKKVAPQSYFKVEFEAIYQKAGWNLEKDLTNFLMSPGRLLCLHKVTLQK